MSRTVTIPNWWGIALTFGLACLLAVPGGAAPLVSTTYAKPTRALRVCLLLLESQVKPDDTSDTMDDGKNVTYWNPDPWILPVLNHSPFKPAGWELENPLAQGTLADDDTLIVAGNFYARDMKGGRIRPLTDASVPGNYTAYPTNWYTNGKNPGDRLTKDDPAYWVVKLSDRSLDALSNFDLLILNGHNACTLSNTDRDNLRVLLDRGVTVWVNNSQRTGVQVDNFFLDPPVTFMTDPAQYPDNPATRLAKADPGHWLLNAYYQLTDQEVNFLRDNTSRRSFIQSGVSGYVLNSAKTAYLTNDNSQIREVVRLKGADTPSGLAPTIAAGQSGRGQVVVTGTDICGAVADWWEYKHNQKRRGNWAEGTIYQPDDAVMYNGTLYICKKNHTAVAATSVAPPGNEPEKSAQWVWYWYPLTLDIWPSDETMHITVHGQPNDHRAYMACAKLFFNMLARPASWPMVSGDPTASRSYGQTFASSLSRAWNTRMTALGDPVSYGDYVAVPARKAVKDTTGTYVQMDVISIYRQRRKLDDAGRALDYPYGLYDEYGRMVTPETLPMWQEGAAYPANILVYDNGIIYGCLQNHTATAASRPNGGATSATYWKPLYGDFAVDAQASSEMDLCFDLYGGRGPDVNPADGVPDWSEYWIGSPVFGTITERLPDGNVINRTVLYALQAREYVDGKVEFYPRSFVLDPLIMNGNNLRPLTPRTAPDEDDVPPVVQIGQDRWAWAGTPLPEVPVFDVGRDGLPRTSMTVSNGRLVITALGLTTANSPWRIYLVDGDKGALRVRLGQNREWKGRFRLTGPASIVSAQVDYEASPLETGQTSGNTNPRFRDMRRDTVEMLVVPGEYLDQKTSATATGGRTAVFLIPPVISATTRSAFMQVPNDLMLVEGADPRTTVQNAAQPENMRKIHSIGNINSDFRKRYVLYASVGRNGGRTINIMFRSWDVFFAQGTQNRPALRVDWGSTPQLTFAYTPMPPAPNTPGQIFEEGVEVAMGYPVLLDGSYRYQLFAGDGTPLRVTMHDLDNADGDILFDNNHAPISGDTFGYRVDAPILTYRDQIIIGTGATGARTEPLLLGRDGRVNKDIYIGGALTGLRLQHPGFSMPGSPSAYPWTGDIAWQFHGDSWGPKLSDRYPWAQDCRWLSDFPFPPAASGTTVFATGLFRDTPTDMDGASLPLDRHPSNYLTQPIDRGMLYAVDPELSPYLQQTVDAARPLNMTAAMAAQTTPLGYQDPDTGVTFLVKQATNAAYRVWVRTDANGIPIGYGWESRWPNGDTYSGTMPLSDPAAIPPDVVVDLPEGATSYVTVIIPVSYAPALSSKDQWVFDERAKLAQLRVAEASLPGALRVGARVVMKVQTMPYNVQTPWYTWDLGTVTAIRKDLYFNTNGLYWITFDRQRPLDGELLRDNTVISLLAATSVPYVSHVQTWNPYAGAETQRQYMLGADTATRIGEGISATPPSPTSPANPFEKGTEMMIGADRVADLPFACHEPSDSDLSTPAVLDVTDNPTFLPADWPTLGHLYVPRLRRPQVGDLGQSAVELNNFIVDHRTGRIELRPTVAANLADRFVMVRYFTNEMVLEAAGPVQKKVLHAELMYVPSPVKWQYQFRDGDLPDSGPVVVNDTVYVTAIRGAGTKRQPVLYAFPTVPDNPQDVRPLWIQSLGAELDNAPAVYRGVTTPTPVSAGLLVGTGLGAPASYIVNTEAEMLALPATLRQVAYRRDTGAWFTLTALPPTVLANWQEIRNEMTLLTDHGTLIADGQRLVRINNDGEVTWQASATTDYDPAALALDDAASRAAGLAQQAYTLVTRVRALPGGNVLVCDAGGNRVVETNTAGTVVWQYPDSDLTYQDPDRTVVDNGGFLQDVPLRADDVMKQLRTVTPAAFRPSGPRDVRREMHDMLIPANYEVHWPTCTAIGNNNLQLVTPVKVRWETTLIADAGNNRIIEVYRPLVSFEQADALNAAYGLNVAPGFQYRPDVFYQRPDGTQVYLVQFADVIVDSTVLSVAGKPLTNPMSFTAAMRYPGPDNLLTNTLPDADPVMDGLRTCETLAVVGNTVADPYVAGSTLRTVLITRRTADVQSQAVQADGTVQLTVSDAMGIGPGMRLRLRSSAGAEWATVTRVSTALPTPTVTVAGPLQFAYNAANGGTLTYDALRNFDTVAAPATPATGGNPQFITLAYATDLMVGETVTIVGQDGSQQTLTVTEVGTPTSATTIRVAEVLLKGYPAGSRVYHQRLNALMIRPKAATPSGSDYDYVNVWQLDLVTLRYTGGYDVHALVVDRAGVREVPLNPNLQTTSLPFEMTQASYAAALQGGNFTGTLAKRYPDVTPFRFEALSARLDAWRKDLVFAPVAVLRLDPENGQVPASDPAGYYARVRYFIAQMNPVANPAQETWMDGKPQRRVHLFESRWTKTPEEYNPALATNYQGWGIVDRDGGYYVYPDPLAPDFPNLPGGTYPLTQPLSIDRD